MEDVDLLISFPAGRLRDPAIARPGPRFYACRALKKKTDERDSAQPDFWSKRYASGKTPWQLDHVPERLSVFIRSLPAGSNILVPGCGEDYRTLSALHEAGHQLTAIDFSSIAVERTKKALPELSDKIIPGDFFSRDLEAAPFDVVYERTFLCSLPPRLWKDYAARVAGLLRLHGRLAGFFFYGEELDPPPYPLTESNAAKIFAPRFDLRKSEPVIDSLSIFAGSERWQEWQLRDR